MCPHSYAIVSLAALIALKQTQRAKDYSVIGELATRLPPEREIEVTTDPDRIIALAPMFGHPSSRSAVRAAHVDRHAVVVALAEEIDTMQQADRRCVAAYEAAAQSYLEACRAQDVSTLGLREAHARMLDIAERLLPHTVEPGPAMPMLSEDDVNLRGLSAEELDAAWDLWFDLAQTTNDSDPMYSHGVFVNAVTNVSGERSVDGGLTDQPGSATPERSRGASQQNGIPSSGRRSH